MGNGSYDAARAWRMVVRDERSRRWSNKVNAGRDSLLSTHPPSLSRLSFVRFFLHLSAHRDDAAGLALITTTTMATAAVDIGYLAASYSVPETTIQSLLSEPTIELVQSLLVQIEAKAREFEDLQSEKLKSDVELDNAVQTGEQRARTLKAAADKAQKETAELRQKVAQEGVLM
jgi:translation initiation factor 2B subunit (eIF-2B alpha/beta/delta family)